MTIAYPVRLLIPILGLLAALPAAAQSTAAARSRVRVSIDCPNTSCDQEFFRTESTFVDHLRQRQDADVNLLITSSPSPPRPLNRRMPCAGR